MAFGGCLVAGLAISVVGSILFAFGSVLNNRIYHTNFKMANASYMWRMNRQVASFAVLYVIGVIVSLIGTGFLVGFGTQFKKVQDPFSSHSILILDGKHNYTCLY